MDILNPLVDFAFKKLFGVEENKDLLIDLINAVVSEKDQIVDLEIKNPYNPKTFRDDKLSILDIKAKGTNNKWYNIEMQIMDQQYYDVRSLYYWSKVYNAQLVSGINYDNLQKTITINFLNFNCLDEEAYHNVYKLKNIKTNNEYSADHLELHFIELKKYHETFGNMLDKWASFLKRAQEYSSTHLPQELQIPSIQKAIDVLEHMYLNEHERESYESRLKWLRDEEMALKKAKADGIEEGIAQGIEKGIMQIIRTMRQSGVEIVKIAELTGISEEKINSIIKSI